MLPRRVKTLQSFRRRNASPPRQYISPPGIASTDAPLIPGERVVYPAHGVGRIDKVSVEEIAGARLECIHVTFDDHLMTLRVPLARAASSGLRRVATSEEFARALEVLGQPPKRSTAMWAKRAVVYEEKIKSGDPHLVAEVVRDLRKNVDSGGQSSSERAVFEAAVERLAAEFAAVERMDRKEAISKVMELTKASRDGAARPERAASSVPAAARNGGPEGVPTHSP